MTLVASTSARRFKSSFRKTRLEGEEAVTEAEEVDSFSRPIPPKFEYKLRRHKQSFGKIATTVVLDKDENLL